MFINIYKITNLLNNKFYVGQTVKPILKRFNEHCYPTDCIKLSNAIQKYGKENFEIKLITIAHTQEIADYWEIFWISKLSSNKRDTGYNIRGGGSRGKISDETKLKISIAKFGKKQSEAHKKKTSEVMQGRVFSEEHKKALSKANKGRVFSEEHKNKLSQSAKIKTFSEEHRKKLSEAGKNNNNASKYKKGK